MNRKLAVENSPLLKMIKHGCSDMEQERCGMLLGLKRSSNNWIANEFIPITNVHHETEYKHYRLDPNEFIEVLSDTTHINDEANKDFVGIFHTHPNNRPIPSRFDIDGAGYNVFYIIYSPEFNSISNHFCTETKKPWKEASLIL